MKLYIMRHGPAEDTAATGRDADRMLTPSGRERVRAIAEALAEKNEVPHAIVSSPLVRARETAELVATGTALRDRLVGTTPTASESGVELSPQLAPGGNPSHLVAELFKAQRRRVMIVGHEPVLSMLVEDLVGGVLPRGMLKGMVVGVKLIEDASVEGRGFASRYRFVLDPKTLTWQMP